MTYVVVDNCIKCKYMDCVEVCPVDCFHEGENMLVIDPAACIDCTVCEPECLIDAIYSDEELPGDQAHFLELNAQYSSLWPVITPIGVVPDDAAEWESVDSKYPGHFNPQPGTGSPRE
jgi:ferredoxin